MSKIILGKQATPIDAEIFVLSDGRFAGKIGDRWHTRTTLKAMRAAIDEAKSRGAALRVMLPGRTKTELAAVVKYTDKGMQLEGRAFERTSRFHRPYYYVYDEAKLKAYNAAVARLKAMEESHRRMQEALSDKVSAIVESMTLVTPANFADLCAEQNKGDL